MRFLFLQFAHELYIRDSNGQRSTYPILPAVSLFVTNHYSFHISNVTVCYVVREILKSNNNLFGSKLSKKIASLPDCCDNRFGFEFLSFNKGCVYT